VIDVGERGDFTYTHADMVNGGWSVTDQLGD